MSILPQSLPNLEGFDFGAAIMPARAVGGDFYDFFPLPGA
jgi:serine phosphatase RsbU (regulator of sigma subunit)